ncbi:exonuclease SbcCD subunit D [Salsuginibacillus kocurii]|uniref:exonuclease SbcCD subunit D n=1 Tax=Salsuginibacillus kocurii TaxID=427078 RepID=UPI00036C90CC|nr:exonuclease SbcCD subunit D [Salsuginibacillus kocurii]
MRILHTADWHLGRTLEGRDRLREHEQFIDELVDICEAEAVDVILMAGDVFDSVNPPARAEELFYESLARLSDNGRRSIALIAGNHDHPERLAAARTIAKKQHIFMTCHPTLEPVTIQVPEADQALQVAALPYPSEARLKESLVEEGEELSLREAYDERIKEIFKQLTLSCPKDHVNVAMSHLFVAGGAGSESERPIEIGGAYTVRASSLPENVQYTALGHLHRPQDVKRAQAPARYAGSPLSFSFSESGVTKSVTVIDVDPRQSAVIKEIPLSCGSPLVRWKATEGLDQVHTWMDDGQDANAWIELELHLNETPSMNDIHTLKKQYPGLLTIRPVFPDMSKTTNEQARQHVPVDELFTRFYERQTGGAIPDEALVQLFMEVLNDDKEKREGRTDEAHSIDSSRLT